MSHLADHVAEFVDTMFDGAEDPEAVLDAFDAALEMHRTAIVSSEPSS